MSHLTLKPIRKSSKHVHNGNDWEADPRGNSRRTGSDFAMRVNRIQCLNSDPFSSSFYVGLRFEVTDYSSFLRQRHSDLSFTSGDAHRSRGCQVKKPVQLLCAATLIMCHYHCLVLLHVAFHRCRQTGFYTLAFLKWSLIYVYVWNGQGCVLGRSIHPIHSFSVQVLFSRVLFYDISRVVFTLTAPSMIFVLYFHFIPLLAETLTVNCQWL